MPYRWPLIITLLVTAVSTSGDDGPAPLPNSAYFHFGEMKQFEFHKIPTMSPLTSIVEYVSEFPKNASIPKGLRIKFHDLNTAWLAPKFGSGEDGEDDFELTRDTKGHPEYFVPRDHVALQYSLETSEFSGVIKIQEFDPKCACTSKVQRNSANGKEIFTLTQTTPKDCPPIACSWSLVPSPIKRKVTIRYTSNLPPADTFYLRRNNEHREKLALQSPTTATVEVHNEPYETRLFYVASDRSRAGEAKFQMEISYDEKSSSNYALRGVGVIVFCLCIAFV